MHNHEMSMRNHIAHGYFDLDDAYVLSVIQHDLQPLLEAIDFLIRDTENRLTDFAVDSRVE